MAPNQWGHEFVPSCIEHGSKAKNVDCQVATLLPGWVQSDSQLLFQVTDGTEQPGRRKIHANNGMM